MLTQPRAAVPLTQRSCCFIETQAALPKDAGWECSPGVREQWLMAKCSHHKHWSELWQGTAGEGCSVLSAAMDSKVEKVTGQKEEWSLQWMERCFPNSDMTRRGWESQQAWRGAGAHQHQVPEMTKFLRDPEELQHGLCSAQEATASSWSRSKVRWKDLLYQHSEERRRAVSISFVLKSISSSRYNICLFTELFWYVLEKNFSAETGKLRIPSQVQILYILMMWFPTDGNIVPGRQITV